MLSTLALTLALAVSAPSAAEQAAIARAYAPTFVFHPDEPYFPTSPLFPLALDNVPAKARRSPGALQEELGTVDARIARYDRLSFPEKLSLATVHWRVYPMREGNAAVIVAEYWCYYPFNRYQVRGGIVPYVVRDDHAHDLERVFLVLERRAESADLNSDESDVDWARRAFRIRRVVANAHAGVVATNQVNIPASRELSTPPDILVELGSHAMASDLDGDGLFTQGVDSSRQSGFVWGIRDHGQTWSHYGQNYMDRRDPRTAIRLCPQQNGDDDRSDAISSPACAPYALASGIDLQQWFEGLDLTARDRARIIGRTPVMMRVFSDVSVEELMVPSDPPDGTMLRRMLRRASSSERGFLAGVMTAVHSSAIMGGARAALPVDVPGVPDLLGEFVAMAPAGRKPRMEATLLGFYRTDAILKVVGGVGWFSGGLRRGVDTVGGFEFRTGRVRVRPTLKLLARDFDTRIVFVF